ncbi:hypothetical protein CC80DRAFT_590631 [Byssothecium circinans]|uniref:Aminoglycoside phosphotransferase domain-containing protein n=1 Tax=Byssothecium circinans TaxID=147558 RepID=A0A6A5U7R0_9PLEO|nr:hypothetical protein CC80DRAFT_590631 [Byssothecium circinans]
MIYLEKHSSVRIPKLYAAFASADVNPLPHIEEHETFYYMVMEFIDGDTLSDVQEQFRELEKIPGDKVHMSAESKIMELVGEQYRKLRSIPPEDPHHFGRINGRAYQRISPFLNPPGPDFQDYGPFNYEKFVERYIFAAKIFAAMGDFGRDFDPMIRLQFRDARSALLDRAGPSDRHPVLSHVDASTVNMMVKLVRDEQGRPLDVEEVVLIDWEYMGWMPPWFEAGEICQMAMSGTPGWFEVLERMGHVNMAVVSFFALCIKHGRFRCI